MYYSEIYTINITNRKFAPGCANPVELSFATPTNASATINGHSRQPNVPPRSASNGCAALPTPFESATSCNHLRCTSNFFVFSVYIHTFNFCLLKFWAIVLYNFGAEYLLYYIKTSRSIQQFHIWNYTFHIWNGCIDLLVFI